MGEKLTKVQAVFLETLRTHGAFVRRSQASHLRPLVGLGFVEFSQDESGFYCAITPAGRQALTRTNPHD